MESPLGQTHTCIVSKTTSFCEAPQTLVSSKPHDVLPCFGSTPQYHPNKLQQNFQEIPKDISHYSIKGGWGSTQPIEHD